MSLLSIATGGYLALSLIGIATDGYITPQVIPPTNPDGDRVCIVTQSRKQAKLNVSSCICYVTNKTARINTATVRINIAKAEILDSRKLILFSESRTVILSNKSAELDGLSVTVNPKKTIIVYGNRGTM